MECSKSTYAQYYMPQCCICTIDIDTLLHHLEYSLIAQKLNIEYLLDDNWNIQQDTQVP